MTSVKNITVGLIIAVSCLLATNVKAELLTELYNINITDNKNGDVGFYQTFNEMFGTTFGSSNEVFNKYGVDPNSTWIVSEQSTLITGAKNQSGFSSSLSMNNEAGDVSFIADTKEVLANEVIKFDVDYLINNVFLTGSDIGFQLDVSRNVGYESQNYTLYSGTNEDGKVYMLALNITDLYNVQYNGDFDSVYMFLWEDWKNGVGVRWGNQYNSLSYGDWDYADFAYIMTNVYTDAEMGGSSTATPEPATLLILGLGAIGVGFTARRRMTK